MGSKPPFSCAEAKQKLLYPRLPPPSHLIHLTEPRVVTIVFNVPSGPTHPSPKPIAITAHFTHSCTSSQYGLYVNVIALR